MNKVLIANSLSPMIVFAENRDAYFRSIDSASGGRKKKYYTFMLDQYLKSLQLFLSSRSAA